MVAREDAAGPLEVQLMSVECPICGARARDAGNKEGHALHRCTGCRHLFFWPQPERTDHIYNKDYFTGAGGGFGYKDYDRDKAPMVGTFHEYLDRIGAANPPEGRMLDIGAATGFFLNLARERGWKVAGVEVSAAASEMARAKGLDVRTGILEEDHGWTDGEFSAITMWDVIEHMPDPHRTMAEVSRLLRPGGLVAINTPDSGSLLSRALGPRWHLVIPYEHLNLFTRQSLENLLSRHGLEVLDVRCIGKKFTVQYVLNTLAAWQRLGVWKRLAAASERLRVHELGLRINLHDNVFVLARKR